MAAAAFAVGGSMPVLHAAAHAAHAAQEGHGHDHDHHPDSPAAVEALSPAPSADERHPEVHPDVLHRGAPAAARGDGPGWAAAPPYPGLRLGPDPRDERPEHTLETTVHTRGPPPGLPARAPPV